MRSWEITPALEEQKPALRMKRFPRQSGMTAERNPGRSACAGARPFLVLNVPSPWRGNKQGSGLYMRLHGPGWPRPGLVKAPRLPVRGPIRHRAPKCGLCVTRKNYKGQFKYSLHFSLPFRISFYFQKQ